MSKDGFKNRPYNTLTSQQKIIKDRLSKINYYLMYKNIVRWEDIDPQVLAEFKKRTSSEQYYKEERERQDRIDAKELKKKERKKLRFIEW